MRDSFIAILFLFWSDLSHAETEDSHRSAAAKYLRLAAVDKVMVSMAPMMTEAMLKGNPLLEPYSGVLRDWAVKTMTWENFEERLVNAYVEAFSEKELQEMIAFYQTPTGQKAIRLQPEMMQRGGEIGNEVAMEHQNELKKMVEKRKAEIEALNAKPSE